MLAIPQSFLEMPRWWHDEAGRAWLADLPVLVARQCDRWQLSLDGAAMHGSNALVVPVRGEDGVAVLRLAPPGDDVAVEVAALNHWAGRGVVRLLDADPDAGISLLERLDPTRSLQSEPILEAVVVLGELARLLAVPAPVAARTTQSLALEAVSSFPADWARLREPTPPVLLESACRAAQWLSGQAAGAESVNGDLHFEQVLRGPRCRWTVVDPVLLRGDPEYDVGRVLWSRLDELGDDRQVWAAFDAFVGAAEVPVVRARAWVVVRAMSYLLWGLQHGLTSDPPRCRRLLDLFA